MEPQKSGTKSDNDSNNTDSKCSVKLNNLISSNYKNEVLQKSCVNNIN